MEEEKFFDYRNYIQKRLKEIDDLDERRYAKELLLNSLGGVFKWVEEKYGDLEKRILDELAVPWNRFSVSMIVIEKENYDPINSFWHPVCGEDIGEYSRKNEDSWGNVSVYLAAGERECGEFLQSGILEGIEEQTGQHIRFRIGRSMRYKEAVKKLHTLFSCNHIPWQTIHMGHLERFFDLVPEKEISADSHVSFGFGDWEKKIKQGCIPLWNIERIAIQSQEFRHPCLDEVIYEHIYHLGKGMSEEDGYLVDAGGNILSIRYEKNKVLLRTKQEFLEDVTIYRLHQGEGGDSHGYSSPVLSNRRRDNFAIRYLQQTGNFIQTPMELYRKVEELSGNYGICPKGYEIVRDVEGKMLEGDMNGDVGMQIFTGDNRSILLLRFHKEGGQEDYLYESQIRYILSQLQMEFLEYKCMGVMV